MRVPIRTTASRIRRLWPRRDESGGAISLWVVLMVPVSAFAAVVAMAGPQRLAAESTMQDAADDLAVFAVAWRDGHNMSTGELPAFPPECAARSEQQKTDLDMLADDIDALPAPLDPADPNYQDYVAQVDALDGLLDAQHGLFRMQQPPWPAAHKAELEERFDALVSRLDEWEDTCRALFEALVRDLGYLGVDMNSLRGFYSDSLTESAMTANCSDPQHTTDAACVDAGEMWDPADPGFDLPCRTTGASLNRDAVDVQDAVHVALAANWQDAGWAAAQVWPDGIPMAAESMGRFSQRDPSAGVTPPPPCGLQLLVLDSQGRPVWAGTDPMPDSRELAQSVRRTTLSG